MKFSFCFQWALDASHLAWELVSYTAPAMPLVSVCYALRPMQLYSKHELAGVSTQAGLRAVRGMRMHGSAPPPSGPSSGSPGLALKKPAQRRRRKKGISSVMASPQSIHDECVVNGGWLSRSSWLHSRTPSGHSSLARHADAWEHAVQQELRDSQPPLTPHSACTDCGLAITLLIPFLRLLLCAGFFGARPGLSLLGLLGAPPPGAVLLLCTLGSLPL